MLNETQRVEQALPLVTHQPIGRGGSLEDSVAAFLIGGRDRLQASCSWAAFSHHAVLQPTATTLTTSPPLGGLTTIGSGTRRSSMARSGHRSGRRRLKAGVWRAGGATRGSLAFARSDRCARRWGPRRRRVRARSRSSDGHPGPFSRPPPARTPSRELLVLTYSFQWLGRGREPRPSLDCKP